MKVLVRAAITIIIIKCKMRIYLNCTAVAGLHQIADVSWLNACSNEHLYIVVVHLFQLETQTLEHEVARCNITRHHCAA